MPPKPKPKKSSEQLKRAADQLDEALEGSPVKKKKSKTNLDEQTINVPNPVIALPDISVPSPEYIALYEPEAALRLTKASNTINFAIDKINYYADLLSVFDNNRDDSAIALAVRTNAKIEKWDNYRENVQKSMDVLLKVAPKKRGSALLDTQTAEGFVSSSGELPIPFFPGSRPSVLIWAFFLFFFHLIGVMRLRVFPLRTFSESDWARPLAFLAHLPPSRLICPPFPGLPAHLWLICPLSAYPPTLGLSAHLRLICQLRPLPFLGLSPPLGRHLDDSLLARHAATFFTWRHHRPLLRYQMKMNPIRDSWE